MTMIMHNRTPHFQSHRSKSLNRGRRLRDLVKITFENQALLRRLQEKQPNYNTQQWEEDRRLAEQRLRSICEFPYHLGVTAEDRSRDTSMQIRRTVSSSGAKPSSTSFTDKRVSTSKPRLVNRVSSGSVVFKRGVNIGGNYFIVEMMGLADKLHIFVHEVEQPSSFSLELPLQEAIELMGGSDRYEVLASMLSVEDGEIVLNEPQDTQEGDREQRPHTREQRPHTREQRPHTREQRPPTREQKPPTREQRPSTREIRARPRIQSLMQREEKSLPQIPKRDSASELEVPREPVLEKTSASINPHKLSIQTSEESELQSFDEAPIENPSDDEAEPISHQGAPTHDIGGGGSLVESQEEKISEALSKSRGSSSQEL
jgi:hypothetical protein